MSLATQIGALFIAAAGLALILQWRRLAGWLFLAGVGAVVLTPFIPYAPGWIVALAAIFVAIGLLRVLLNATVGRTAASGALSILVADVVRFLFLAPFRLLGSLINLLLGREEGARWSRRRRRQ